jgi:hypothetical protein
MRAFFNIKSPRVMKVEIADTNVYIDPKYDQLIKDLLTELEDWPAHRISYGTWKWDSQDQLEKFITYFTLKYPHYV